LSLVLNVRLGGSGAEVISNAKPLLKECQRKGIGPKLRLLKQQKNTHKNKNKKKKKTKKKKNTTEVRSVQGWKQLVKSNE